MSIRSLIVLALVLAAAAAFASDMEMPDRSILWRMEEAAGKVLPPHVLENWSRDAVYGYDVDHVHLDLAVDPAVEHIVASGVLSVTITEAGLTELPVDLNDALTVLACFVDGLPMPFDTSAEQVSITLPGPSVIGAQHDLRVDYQGTPEVVGNKSMHFRTHSGTPEVFTLSTPYSSAGATTIPISHYWRPCKDVPDDKSTWSLAITIPDDMLACSTGRMMSNTDNGNGTRTVTWEHGYEVAPYLITFGVTNYQIIEEDYDETTLVQHFVYPERYNHALESFNITVPAMEFMASVFGEYPFVGEKYGMFSTTWGPAVEEQTMTAYPWGFINGQHNYDWLLVHEMAHMWWGDCVTCQDWKEVWLNEGFASYTEALWREHLFGFNSYISYMLSMDNGPYDGSIYDPPYIWHAIVYDKGGWILHMLRHIMGDDDFFQFLQDYRAIHEYSSVTTEDLVAVAEVIEESDLDWFFEPWIYHEGRPAYQFNWSTSEFPYTVHLTIAQTQSILYPTYTMPIDVEITTNSGVEEHVIWNSERLQYVDIPVGDLPTDVRLDRWHWILADFEEVVTAVPGEAAQPAYLAQNVPNPFNPKTQIRFSLSQAGRASLRIFDMQGRMQRTLLAGPLAAGEHVEIWDGRDDQGRELASGVYLYRLVGADGVQQRKMTLLR